MHETNRANIRPTLNQSAANTHQHSAHAADSEQTSLSAVCCDECLWCYCNSAINAFRKFWMAFNNDDDFWIMQLTQPYMAQPSMAHWISLSLSLACCGMYIYWRWPICLPLVQKPLSRIHIYMLATGDDGVVSCRGWLAAMTQPTCSHDPHTTRVAPATLCFFHWCMKKTSILWSGGLAPCTGEWELKNGALSRMAR